MDKNLSPSEYKLSDPASGGMPARPEARAAGGMAACTGKMMPR